MVANKKAKEKKTQVRKAKEVKKMTKKEMMTMPKEAPEVVNKTNQ